MDAFELNKIAGAVLFALLVIFGTKTVTDMIFKAPKPEKPGFEVEIAETAEGRGEAGGKEAKEAPIANLLAQASADKGLAIAKKCAACHTFDKGGANKIGPNLHDVVGRPLGSVDGFAYSGALKDKGGNWDYEALNQFIANPKDYINGTKMAFPGIKQGQQRADLLLYLREQSDNPPPLPQPAAEEKPAAPAKEAPAAPQPEAPTQEAPAVPQPEAPAQPSSPSQGG